MENKKLINRKLIELKDIIDKIPYLLNDVQKTMKNYLTFDFSNLEIKFDFENITQKQIETYYDLLDEPFKLRKMFSDTFFNFLGSIKKMETIIKSIYELSKFDDDINQWRDFMLDSMKKEQDKFITRKENELKQEEEKKMNEIEIEYLEENNLIHKESEEIEQRTKELEEEMKRLKMRQTEIGKKYEIIQIEHQQKKEEIQKNFENQNKSLKQHSQHEIEMFEKQIRQHPKIDNDKMIISRFKNKLVEWCGKPSLKLLFDSHNKPIMKNKTFDFEKIILNQKDLIYIIFDSENNIFGGYIDNPVEKLNTAIFSNKMFLFSLRNEKKKDRPKRFLPKENPLTFVVTNEDHGLLFSFGYNHQNFEQSDIVVAKHGVEERSFCGYGHFNYQGEKNSFTSKPLYEMRRVMVFQALDDQQIFFEL